MFRYKSKIWFSHFLQFFRSSDLSLSLQDKQFVFGVGTGRSGTKSLGKLLNLQESIEISHELKPILSWDGDSKYLHKKLNQIASKSEATTCGDVASSYLPYVEAILEIIPNAKFVCLKRDMEETINSFMHKSGKRNHWISHDGRKWKKDYWDRFFPKYEISDKSQAIERYWIEYYTRSEKLMKQFPDNFIIYDISILSKLEKQKALFQFLEVQNPRLQIVHANSK